MKRYEKMTREEIMENYKACSGYCSECPVFDTKTDECKYSECDCTEAMFKYLNEEIKLKTVSRWQTIKSDGDFGDYLKSVTNRVTKVGVMLAHTVIRSADLTLAL